MLVARGVAVDGAGERWPGLADDEQAALAGLHGCAFFGDDFRHDSEEGHCRGAGFGGYGAGDGREQNGTGFGLPPGVDDGAALLADFAVVPHPGFGVDGLADGTQQAKRGERVAMDEGVAPLDEGADGGRRGVEDGDFVLVDDAPEAVILGEVGSAFVHHDGGSIGERAVDDIGMAGDPADVGGAPEDVVVVKIEDVLGSEKGLDAVAASGVEQTFGLAGGTAGVEQKERIFGVHGLGRALRGSGAHGFVPPKVATCLHVDGRLRGGCARDGAALVNKDGVDGGTLGECLIDDLLELDLGAAAVGDVLRNDGDAGGIVDAVDDGVRGEATEDDGVDGADAGAGEQRDGELGAHAHIDGDAVAFADAAIFEDVAEALDLLVKIGIGELADFSRLAFPEQGDLVGAGTESVAVDTVVAKVELAAGEPASIAHFAFEHMRMRSEPVEFGGGRGPEDVRVFDALAVEGFVFGEALDVGLGGELGRRRKDAVFPQEGFHVAAGYGRRCRRFGAGQRWIPLACVVPVAFLHAANVTEG